MSHPFPACSRRAGRTGSRKHAVLVLTESLYQDLAKSAPHVKVSVLCPGWVATEFYRVDQSRPERFQRGDDRGHRRVPGDLARVADRRNHDRPARPDPVRRPGARPVVHRRSGFPGSGPGCRRVGYGQGSKYCPGEETHSSRNPGRRGDAGSGAGRRSSGTRTNDGDLDLYAVNGMVGDPFPEAGGRRTGRGEPGVAQPGRRALRGRAGVGAGRHRERPWHGARRPRHRGQQLPGAVAAVREPPVRRGERAGGPGLVRHGQPVSPSAPGCGWTPMPPATGATCR